MPTPPGEVQEQLYPAQAVVQVILLLLAITQIPIMLFFKPFYLRWEYNCARTLGHQGLRRLPRVSAVGDCDLGQRRIKLICLQGHLPRQLRWPLPRRL
jgi:V-type H+-transporting ATPase subunit a